MCDKRARRVLTLACVVAGTLALTHHARAQGTDGGVDSLQNVEALDAGAPPASEGTDAGSASPLPALAEADAGVAAPPPPVAVPPPPPTVATPHKVQDRPKGDDDDDDGASDHDPPLWTGTTRFASRYYELGVTAGMGGLVHAPGAEAIGMSGLTVQEHHGLVSKVGVALLVALGQSNSRYVGSTTTVEGNYIVRRDYYRSLTPAERAAQAAALASAINGEYTTTLTVYSRNFLGVSPGSTQASGAEFSLGVDFNTFDIGALPSVLTLGFFAGSLSAPVTWKGPANPLKELTYTNVGMVGRWHFPATRYADLYLEWDANIIQLFIDAEAERLKGNIYTSPLKLGAYAHLTDRAYLKGQATFGGLGFSEGRFGVQAEIGVRF